MSRPPRKLGNKPENAAKQSFQVSFRKDGVLLCHYQHGAGRSEAQLRIINFKTTTINAVLSDAKLSYLFVVPQPIHTHEASTYLLFNDIPQLLSL